MCRIITLTTDFGIKGYAAGALKGAIYSYLKQSCLIVDISHHIEPFNISECAYILKNSYQNFPQGSIHIIGVDCDKSPEQKHIAAQFNGHYFIGADNGILSLVTEGANPDYLVEIMHQEKTTFSALHVFSKVAIHITQNKPLDALGTPLQGLKDVRTLQPFTSSNGSKLQGHVVYIDDSYGNVVTNITRPIFENTRQGRTFEARIAAYTFKNIYNTYNEGIDFGTSKDIREEDGKRLLVFNSSGNLEVLIYKSNLNTVGGASNLLGINYTTPVIINFS